MRYAIFKDKNTFSSIENFDGIINVGDILEDISGKYKVIEKTIDLFANCYNLYIESNNN